MFTSIRASLFLSTLTLAACSSSEITEDNLATDSSAIEEVVGTVNPPPGFEVHTASVTPGAQSWFIASHAVPGQTVYFVYGTAERVPAPNCRGMDCMSVTPPKVMGSAVADANGVAIIQFRIPGNLRRGGAFIVQAAEVVRGVAETSVLNRYTLGSAPSGPGCSSDGVTWTWRDRNPGLGADLVGCEPNICDAYDGNHQCSDDLPLLCLNQTGAPNPGFPPNFYQGWAEGDIQLTPAVPGCLIQSFEEADAFCTRTVGSGYQWADHHNGGGGWNWRAYGNLPVPSEFWVSVDNQPNAHCF